MSTFLMEGGFLCGVSIVATGAGSYFVWRKVLGFLFLPSQIVYAINQARIEDSRKAFLTLPGYNSKRVRIPVDGSKSELDAVILKSQIVNGKPKFLIHLNANGVCYEDKLEPLMLLQRDLSSRGYSCSMLGVNYRGVGGSSGSDSKGAADIVKDAVSAIMWVHTTNKVEFKDIILHGHSIGGAAAVLACGELLKRKLVDIPMELPFVFADRTFYDLGEIVNDKLLEGAFDMRAIGGIIVLNMSLFLIVGLLCVTGFPHVTYISTAISSLVSASVLLDATETWIPPSKLVKLISPVTKNPSLLIKVMLGVLLVIVGNAIAGAAWQLASTAFAAGYFLGKMNLLNGLAIKLVKFLGWDMNLKESWKLLDESRKLVTFHEHDQMIPTDLSLKQLALPQVIVQLKMQSMNPHMYEFLSENSAEKINVMNLLRSLFFDN